MLETEKVETQQLTPQQNERYNYLLTFHESDAAFKLITKYISSKGTNSWASFVEKLSIITRSSYEQKAYEDSMYDTVELDTVITIETIIQKVTQVRSELNLPRYSDRIKVRCLQDFLNLFIVEKVYEDDSIGANRKEIGYKPVFKIKPD